MNIRRPSISKDKAMQHPLFWGITVLLLLIPSLCILGFTYGSTLKCQRMDERIDQLKIRAQKKVIDQKDKIAFNQTFQVTEHFYLDKYLEKAILQQDAVEAIKIVCAHPAFKQSNKLQERAHALEIDNRLSFQEIARHTNASLEEIELRQLRPVEVNMTDVKKILAWIEGVKVGPHHPYMKRPQFVIKSFDLNKKHDKLLLNMTVIQRERI